MTIKNLGLLRHIEGVLRHKAKDIDVEVNGSVSGDLQSKIDTIDSSSTDFYSHTRGTLFRHPASDIDVKSGNVITGDLQTLLNSLSAFSGGNFITVNAAADLRITAGADGYAVLMLGHSTPYDGGAGIFTWNSGTATDDDGTIFHTGGYGVSHAGYWQRMYEGHLNVRWFGATGAGVVSDCTAMQKAIDTAISVSNSSGRSRAVYFPPGIYRLAAGECLFACLPCTGVGGHIPFSTVDLIGDGDAFGNYGSANIKCDDLTLPAIIYAATRSSKVEGITITGGNDWGSYSGVDPRAHYDSFWAGDVNFSAPYTRVGTRTNSFSPHCAIAIDPFSSTVAPANQYTSVNPTIQAKFDNLYLHTGWGGSSGIRIQNAYITNWYMGVGNSLSGYTTNAENIYVDNSQFWNCVYPVVNGQTQGRNIVVTRCYIVGFHTAFSRQGGAGTGVTPVATGCNLVGGRFITDYYSFGSGGDYQLTCESIMSIGFLSGYDPVTFRSSEFDFFATPAGYPEYPRAIISGSGPKFQSCWFGNTNRDSSLHWWVVASYINVPSFSDCVFFESSTSGKAIHWFIGTGGAGPRVANAIFDNCYMTGKFFGRRFTVDAFTDLNSARVVPGAIIDCDGVSETANAIYYVSSKFPSYEFGTRTVTINGDGTGSVAISGADNTHVSVGDVLSEALEALNIFGYSVAGGIGRVSAVTADTISLEHVPLWAPAGVHSWYIIRSNWAIWDTTAVKTKLIHEDSSGNITATGSINTATTFQTKASGTATDGLIFTAIQVVPPSNCVIELKATIALSKAGVGKESFVIQSTWESTGGSITRLDGGDTIARHYPNIQPWTAITDTAAGFLRVRLTLEASCNWNITLEYTAQ